MKENDEDEKRPWCDRKNLFYWISGFFLFVMVYYLLFLSQKEYEARVKDWENCPYERDLGWKIFKYGMDLNGDDIVTRDECVSAEIDNEYSGMDIWKSYDFRTVQDYCYVMFFEPCEEYNMYHITNRSMLMWGMRCIQQCSTLTEWAKYFHAEHLLNPEEITVSA